MATNKMFNPQRYKPTAKTVVTEMRQFIVDASRKIASARQTVAAEILDASLNQLDVVVGKENPYTLKDVRGVVSINTPSPVMLELTAFGEISEQESRTDHQFKTATLTVDPVEAGNMLFVVVEDDVFSKTLQVEAFNLRTGETEFITLRPVARNKYRGFVMTVNSRTDGVSFDNVMFCAKGDIVRLTYLDAFSSEGLSQNIQTEVVVESNVKETVLSHNNSSVMGDQITFLAENVDVPSCYVSVKNPRTGDSLDVPLYKEGEHWIGTMRTGWETTSEEFGVEVGDILDVVFRFAQDDTGLATVIHNYIAIEAPGEILGTINAPDAARLYGEVEVMLSDFDLGSDEAVVTVNNQRTATTKHVQLKRIMPGLNIYKGTFELMPDIGLPGDSLEVMYFDYRFGDGTHVVSHNIRVMSQVASEETVEEEETLPDMSVSKPVTMVINGLFVLNGSFAGTLKLFAPDENDVRCTIVKA